MACRALAERYVQDCPATVTASSAQYLANYNPTFSCPTAVPGDGDPLATRENFLVQLVVDGKTIPAKDEQDHWGCLVPIGVVPLHDGTETKNTTFIADAATCTGSYQGFVKPEYDTNRVVHSFCEIRNHTTCSNGSIPGWKNARRAIPSIPDSENEAKGTAKNLDNGAGGEVTEALAFLNKRFNDGFLPWVGARGMGCIHRVTGKIYGIDSWGQAHTPGWSAPPPASRCAGACHQVGTKDDAMCFECVMNALKDDWDQYHDQNQLTCPEINPTDPADATLLRDAVHCANCAGEQALNYAEAYPWGCINGDIHRKLSEVDIILIVLGGIVLVALFTFVGMYVHWEKRRKPTLREQAYLHQEAERGKS